MNRKPLEEQVADLAQENRADVVILAECITKPVALLRALNGPQRQGGFHLSRSANSVIRIYSRFAAEFLQPAFDSDHVSIRKLVLPARPEILLVAVHLPSKQRWSTEGQSL